MFSPHRETFTKDQRLRKRTDIQRVFEHGDVQHGATLTLLTMDNALPHARACFVVPKKYIATATERNLLRRRLATIFRINRKKLTAGRDYIVLCKGRKNKGALLTYTAMEAEFLLLCQQAGLIKNDKKNTA